MSSTRRTSAGRVARIALTALCVLPLGAVQAQQAPARSGTSAPPMTLATIAQAAIQQDYSVDQLRRFRDEQGGVVTVREQLLVDANGVAEPRFQLTYLGVVGEPKGSPLDLVWRGAYERHSAEFFHHGSFRVRDLAKASANYTLHDFGMVVRAGRSARRLVIFPLSSDKPVWVVDADAATAVPLFFAEFDDSMQVLSEVEATAFDASVPAFQSNPARVSIRPAADFPDAESMMRSPRGLVEPDMGSMPDYDVDSVVVRQDPLNGREQLVMSFTDGIDQFLVVETPGSSDPFTGLPAANGGHVIARFRDPALSALVFHEDGVSFQISGRGSLHRLDELTRQIYRQALAR